MNINVNVEISARDIAADIEIWEFVELLNCYVLHRIKDGESTPEDIAVQSDLKNTTKQWFKEVAKALEKTP